MPNFREFREQRLEIAWQLILADEHRVVAVRHNDFVLERVGVRSRYGAAGGEQLAHGSLYACCTLTAEFGGIDISAERDPREPTASSDSDSHACGGPRAVP
jgi:hypothetical protein